MTGTASPNREGTGNISLLIRANHGHIGAMTSSTRQPMFNAPPWSLRLAGLLLLIHLAFFLMPDDLANTIGSVLVFVPAALDAGIPYYWTLLTYALIHADVVHVGFNAALLLALGSYVERTVGGTLFLLIFSLCAIGGALAFWVLSGNGVMLGASGGVDGLMGAAAVLLYRNRDADPRARMMMVMVCIVVVMNLLMAFSGGTGVAWQAHLGGLFCGLVYGYAVQNRAPRGIIR